MLNVDYLVPSTVENAVEPQYLDSSNKGQLEEFTTMECTAAACGPNDFTLKTGYDLRLRMYNRHTELLIAITYYNKNMVLLTRKLYKTK